MITSQQALQLVLEHSLDLGEELVSLDQSAGRVLTEDIFADRPFPPFDRVCMDGISLDHAAFRSGQRIFRIQGIQAAGAPPLQLQDPSLAIEVMTGAKLPPGTTTVVRYEDLEKMDEHTFKVLVDIGDHANIHNEGSDQAAGTLLMAKNREIRSAELAILATVGQHEVRVRRQPRVMIISTGDELVPVTATPEAHQIRRSNVHMLKAECKKIGVEAELAHLDDDRQSLLDTLPQLFQGYDVVMMSGGVSKGKFDYIPEVITQLGMTTVFHKVAQRPGKPFLFGVKGGCLLFGFPGNPVSTLVGFKKYFLSWLYESYKITRSAMMVELANDFFFKPDLTYFAQARISHEGGRIRATIEKGNGSGDMVNLVQIDGFLELPPDRSTFHCGEVYPFLPL